MTHYIESKAKDGSVIKIEVTDTSKHSAGFTRESNSPTDVSGDASADAFVQALQTIQSCATGVIETLQKLETMPPNAAAFDFSVKVDAEVGAMIAKSRDEGQFKVSLSWKQPEPESKTDSK
jgi:acetamidase/formamidase